MVFSFFRPIQATISSLFTPQHTFLFKKWATTKTGKQQQQKKKWELPIIGGGWRWSHAMPCHVQLGNSGSSERSKTRCNLRTPLGCQLAVPMEVVGSMGWAFFFGGFLEKWFLWMKFQIYTWVYLMKDMKKHTVEGRNHEFPFTEGFATFPLPTNSPNNQICPHFPHEQLIEDQFGTLQGGRLSSRCWVRLRANRKTWTASFYCGQLWMVLRGDNSWKFIWQVSVFQVVPTFGKKGSLFIPILVEKK